MLNDWSGKQVIDEEGNKILTSLLVAGEKNRFNQFTGVVVGDVQQTHSNTSNELNGYGVYGFKDGTNRFKLDEDGNFFVGQNDGSYLKFDDEGFMLNLKSGNFIIDSNNFSVNSNGDVYMKGIIEATSGGSIGGWKIDSTSLRYAQNGRLTFLEPGGIDAYCEDSNTRNLVIGSGASGSISFGVGYDGSLYSSNANITGTITAKEGDIAGWKIDSYTLSGGSNETGSSYFYLCANPNGDDSYMATKDPDNNWCFCVDKTGHLHATGATIGGHIEATSGSFKGTLSAGSYVSGNIQNGTFNLPFQNGYQKGSGFKLTGLKSGVDGYIIINENGIYIGCAGSSLNFTGILCSSKGQSNVYHNGAGAKIATESY